MKLRDYQQEIIDSVVEFLWEKPGNPLVASPTGTGKTAAFNGLIQTIITRWPGTRIMVVTHVKEIIAQNVAAMLRFWPDAPVGIYSAGLGKKDTRDPIIYCGIDSVFRRVADFGKINLLFIDEAHMLSPKQGSKFQKLIAALQEVNPKLRVVGFSATPYRLGQGHLTEDGVFTDVCIDLTETERFNKFVEDGYLCKLVTKAPETFVDVSGVKIRNGDFDAHDAEALINTDVLNRSMVREIIARGVDRKHWLIFAAGKMHANNLAKEFRAHGVECGVVLGETTKEERDSIISDFKSGKLRSVVNVGVLTTGFDHPPLDLIAVARATQSTALWIQMLGRGTRISDGKENCLVLDYCGNIRRCGPINAPVLPKPKQKGKSGDAPVKICPECQTYCHTRATVCPECGHVFPPSSCLESTASTEEVMVTEAVTPLLEEFPVYRVAYKGHVSKQGNACVKVTYVSAGSAFDEYLPNREEPWFKTKWRKWWEYRQGQKPVPDTVEDFLERTHELKPVRTVRVVTNRKYPQVEAALL